MLTLHFELSISSVACASHVISLTDETTEEQETTCIGPSNCVLLCKESYRYITLSPLCDLVICFTRPATSYQALTSSRRAFLPLRQRSCVQWPDFEHIRQKVCNMWRTFLVGRDMFSMCLACCGFNL